jgi:enamine deaminase RidA (YjgF/YER057c/UK114 family)
MVPVARPLASYATAVDGWVFATGQLPIDPDDDDGPLPEGIEAQTRQLVKKFGGFWPGRQAGSIRWCSHRST